MKRFILASLFVAGVAFAAGPYYWPIPTVTNTSTSKGLSVSWETGTDTIDFMITVDSNSTNRNGHASVKTKYQLHKDLFATSVAITNILNGYGGGVTNMQQVPRIYTIGWLQTNVLPNVLSAISDK